MKQTSVRGGTKLSGRNINLENVGKVLRTSNSDGGVCVERAGGGGGGDEREFVADTRWTGSK